MFVEIQMTANVDAVFVWKWICSSNQLSHRRKISTTQMTKLRFFLSFFCLFFRFVCVGITVKRTALAIHTEIRRMWNETIHSRGGNTQINTQLWSSQCILTRAHFVYIFSSLWSLFSCFIFVINDSKIVKAHSKHIHWRVFVALIARRNFLNFLNTREPILESRNFLLNQFVTTRNCFHLKSSADRSSKEFHLFSFFYF